MFKRVLSAVVLLPLLFFVIGHGGIYIYIAGTLLSVIGLQEFFKVFKKNGNKPLEYTCYISNFTMNTLIFLSNLNYSYIVVNALFTIILVGAYFLIKKKITLEDIMISLMGFIYVSVFLSHVNLLSQKGSMYIWLVFIFAWVTDTFAYFSGYFFGKRKLIPEISPKKTVEGAIGGILGTVVFTFCFAVFAGEPNPVYFIPLAIIGSVVSQLGDLFASAIKRKYDVKDYGNIIPGHGGVLDRFDSILFTAPLTYYGVTFIEFLQM